MSISKSLNNIEKEFLEIFHFKNVPNIAMQKMQVNIFILLMALQHTPHPPKPKEKLRDPHKGV